MITYCQTCRRHTKTDTMPGHYKPGHPQHLPARRFCASCGFFHGYDETVEAEETEPQTSPASWWTFASPEALARVWSGITGGYVG